MLVYAMIAEGFEEIEAIAFIDILRRADIDIKTVSIGDSTLVRGAHGIEINTDSKLNEIDSNLANAIFLPGGMPGTTNLMNNSRLTELLKSFYANDKFLIAICAAPMIFGQLGFLKNKKATCYPSFEKYLTDAIISNDEVCVCDNMITSRGAGTAHLLAFEFVRITKGESVASQLKDAMQYSKE